MRTVWLTLALTVPIASVMQASSVWRRIASNPFLRWVNTFLLGALLIPLTIGAVNQQNANDEANRARMIETYDAVITTSTAYMAARSSPTSDGPHLEQVQADFDAAYFTALMYASSNSTEENVRVFAALNKLMSEVHDERDLDQKRFYTRLLNLVIATCSVHNSPSKCSDRALLTE